MPACPDNYIYNPKTGKCEFNYLPGDANLDGTPNTKADQLVPDVVLPIDNSIAAPRWIWYLLAVCILLTATFLILRRYRRTVIRIIRK